MKFRSFLRYLDIRWFRGLKVRPTRPIRRHSSLNLETLERRELLATRPVILAVNPADGSSITTATPKLTVTYSEPMGPSAAVASNYLLFGSAGNSVGVTSVSLSAPDISGHETATLTYNGSTTGLVLDTYTLFVRGDQIAASDSTTMALPGQVIVANSGRSDASVINIPGNGTLSSISQYGLPTGATSTTFATPVAVVMGNLTGQTGENDLVVLSGTTGQIDIFLGQSGGGYHLTPDLKLQLSSTTETGPKAILLGTFSGGTLPDIVVANSTSNNVTAFQNQSTAGNLIFGSAQDFGAGNTPVSLAAGDFDNDGHLDLAVGSTAIDGADNYDIVILPGLGNSSFFGSPAATIAVGNSSTSLTPANVIPSALATGTFDNNATPDLLVGGSGGVEVLLNSSKGAGKFTFATPIALTTTTVTNVAAGVLRTTATPSSQADVVALDAVNNLVDIWQNTGSSSVGSASFAATAVTFSTGANPQGLALAPLIPGDSRLDILLTLNNGDTSTGGSGGLTVLQNISTLGSTSFALVNGNASYGVDGNPVALAVGDTNGDGIPDVVTVNNTTSDFTLLEGKGDGTLLNAGNTSLTPQLVAVTSADLNSDGIPDLIFAENNTKGASSVTVMLGLASGGYGSPFTFLPSASGQTIRNIVSIAAGDVTGDGRPDILVLDQQDATVGVLANNMGIGASTATLGTGSFIADSQISLSSSGFFGTKVAAPTQLVLGAFTSTSLSNGLDDILVSSLGSSGGGFHGGTSGGVVLLANNTKPKANQTSFSFGGSSFVTGNIAAQGIAAADFNADGNLDFVAIYSNNNSGYANVYTGDGTGKFILQNNKPITLDIASPVSVAAADLNGDGLADFVVASQSTSQTAGGLDIVLNSFGTGFAKPIQTQVLPGTALQTVTIVNLNNDAFPDIVVTTAPGTGGTLLDNVFTLLNNGDGTLQNPAQYLAGGTSSPTLAPSYAISVGNPLIRVTTFHSGGSTVNANLIVNGTFEVPDLVGVPGNLLGWQTYDLPNSPGGSYGKWSIQTGTTSPLSFSAVSAPAGKYQAMLDEQNLNPHQKGYSSSDSATYAGSHALYQDITIPNLASKVTLTLTLTAYNFASAWSDNTSAGPQALDYRNSSADQQVRVDIIDTVTGDILGSTGATGVLQNLFLSSSTTALTFSQTITADLTSFHGKTVRLRVAETNNQGLLIVGVDNVSVNTIFNDTLAPTLTNIGLRNAGFTDSSDTILANGQLPQHTTDATLVGQVGDAGSVNNLSFIEIDPGNTNFTGSAVYKISSWDALGNFTFNIPNPLPGLQTVDVLVVNKAGQSASTTFTYFYQGPSLTDWQAYGPDAISTTGQSGINYANVSGSITALAVDPTDTSGNTYYIGSINGGVWKTTDGGNDWTPLTDYITDSKGTPVPVPVGALAVSKTLDTTTKTHVVYAATGVGSDNLDARGGFGVLISTDGGQTWNVDGNSGTVLAGAQITSMVVDNDDPNLVYVGVAAGGQFGAGVYKTSNALNVANATWTDLTSDSVMFTSGNSSTTLSSGTNLMSVTSLIEDPFNTGRLIIGIGDIGLTSNGSASTEGVWLSSNHGQSWIIQTGGDGSISNSTLPSGSKIGRVIVAMGTGREGDENTVYVLMGTPPSSTTAPSFNYGSDYSGNAGSALFKSSNNMLDWTNVMLRVNTAGNQSPTFTNLTLLGNNAANAGALLVDPGNANVVYIGGSTRWSGNPGGTSQPFIRVDTGNMDGPSGTNTGDDASKLSAGSGNYYDAPTDGDAYKGEGVYWYNLEQNAINDSNSKVQALVPPNIQVLAFDSQGRLLIGTDSGLWRGVSQGYGYDFNSGGAGIIHPGKGQNVINPPGMAITSLNGNLQIADLTSVAIDPTQFGVLYTTMYNTGASGSSSVLNWTSEALSGPTINNNNLGIITAGAIRVSSPAPDATAGTPTTLFRVWEYANSKAVSPETSSDSGNSWNSINSTGIPVTSNPAGTFPAFVVNPTPFLNSGLYENELLFGTNRVFITKTSGTVWDQFSPVLSGSGGLITALAYAPSSDSVFFAGTNLGEVFATTNDGGQWNEVDNKLPKAQVNDIVIDPNSSGTAYAMFGIGNATATIGHIFKTTDDGQNWTNITNNLPTTVTSANSMVIVPSATGSTIYLATNVGVFQSTNGGSQWTRLGVGLPNVPVVDLEYNANLGVIAAATQGRGVFTLSTDKTGPHVTAIALGSVTTTVTGSTTTTTVGAIDVTFNKPIDPRTVTLSTLAITGPGGVSDTIALKSVVSLDQVTNEEFQVNFATPRSTNGLYSITVNSTVKDLIGNQMDQNQNGVNGENPGDIFSGRLLFQPGTNHAPVISPATAVSFTATNEDGFNTSNDSIGTSVSAWISNTPVPITDADSGAVKGIAITSVDDSTGIWQYSQDTGKTWNNITGVGETNALLLQGSAKNMLRYVPGTAYDSATVPPNNILGSASFTFRAWDLTTDLTAPTGADGGFADTSSNGGSTAYSTAEVTAVDQIFFDNHTPTFTVAGSQNGNQTILETGSATPTVQSVNWATALSAGDPNESGQTLNFQVSNNNSSLFNGVAGQPSITVNGSASAGFTGTLNYQQAQYANGTATVTVALHDNGGTANFGSDTSSSITFTITITPVNQAPSFTVAGTQSGNQTILESAAATPPVQTVTGWATAISAGPANESSQTVSFKVGNNNNGLFAQQPAIDSSGTLTYEPNQFANGTATVTVFLQDNGGTANGGVNQSPQVTFTITITPVNQAPSFTVSGTQKGNQSILESAAATPPVQTVTAWATAISAGPANESSQTVSFKVSNDNNSLFVQQPAISSSGVLTYELAQYANGTANVTAYLQDSGDTSNGGHNQSAPITFTITVLPVNQPPTFLPGGDQGVTADTGPNLVTYTVPGWATFISPGPANQASETLSFVVTNNNNSLFAVQPAIDPSGNLTFQPAAFANGTAAVQVILQSSGSTANGGQNATVQKTFNINVFPVNQPPTFTGGGNQTASVYDAQHVVGGWATAMNPGSTNESWQTLTFHVTTDNPSLFATPPTVGADGTLTYSSGAHIGTANVMVTLQDNGGTANGGQDTSAVYMFTITVNPVIASGTADQTWISQVYRDLLGREIMVSNPNEVSYWTDKLDSGSSRLDVAKQIANSDGWRINFVQSLFQSYLGKSADQNAIDYYINKKYHTGSSDQDVQATILSSAAYFLKNGNNNTGFVTGLYENVLGQSPQALDTNGIAYWANQITSGKMTTYAVALALVGMPSAQSYFVQTSYLHLLGRSSDATAYWQSQLQGGMSYGEFQANLVATGEYAFRAVRYYNPVPDQKWLNQVFLDTLGRNIDAGGQTYFINKIISGVRRPDIAAEILRSDEFRKDEVAAAFQTILHRPADSGTVNYFFGFLTQGYSIEQVKALMFASGEYFNSAGGNNGGFLAALYNDALNTPLDQNGRDTYGTQLAQGVVSPNIISDPNADPVRESVALAVLTSNPGYQAVVTAAYPKYLRRAVDGGLSYWAGQLAQGMTDEMFFSKLLGSPEYYTKYSN